MRSIREIAEAVQGKGMHMSFGAKVKEKAFLACARHCCICHRFRGLKMECHHIVMKNMGGKNDFENCIPLCFDCHGDMRSYDTKHPKGAKYSETELRAHRDAWYAKVACSPIEINYPDQSAKLDRRLSERLCEKLPWRTVDFVRNHHFRAAFRSKQLDPLEDFYQSCHKPSFEFIDAEMEGYRANMQQAAQTLLTTVAENVFAGNNPEIVGIPKEWEQTAPERHKAIVTKMHAASCELADAYVALVRTARRKLGAEISD